MPTTRVTFTLEITTITNGSKEIIIHGAAVQMPTITTD
jgi:hypothetical protein